MAATDARPIPQKSIAYRVYFPIFDSDGDLVTGATGLDSEISQNGAAFFDCANEAVEIATASGMYYLDLTTGEMNADSVCIIVKTTSSGAKTTPIVFYPEESGDIRVVSAEIIAAILDSVRGLRIAEGTIGATGNDATHIHLPTLGYPDDGINGMLLVLNDVSTGLWYGRFVQDWVFTTKLATVATLPITPQASTDKFYLHPITEDVNLEKINQVNLTGTGIVGDLFRPG
jgi:hypothetical protein